MLLWFLELFVLLFTSKSTCPIMQAGACSIWSRLWRSHGWLCSIRSCLRRSYSAFLIYYKKVKLKKKNWLAWDSNVHRSIASRMLYHHSTLDYQLNENKCSIYYQLCLGCGLQECRWSFGKNRLHPGIQSAVDGERLGLRRCKNKLRVPRRWTLHFEQVWHGSLHPRWRSTRPKKCGRTDGFSALYSR